MTSQPGPRSPAAILAPVSLAYPATAEGLSEVLLRLARVAERHPDCAASRLERLQQQRWAAGETACAVDALYLRFYLLEARGRALELLPALQLAAQAAAGAGMSLQAARVAEALGRVAYQQGNYLDATEQWSRAVDLAESGGDGRVGVVARVGLGQIHYALGAWHTGLRFQRDALKRLQSLPGAASDSYLLAKVALNLGVGHLESGQLEDAERQFSHALAAARRGRHREFEAECHWYLARAALARGQWPLASADCRLALNIAGRLQHHWLEAEASRTWTAIALARGDEAGAIRSAEHGLLLAERIASKPQQRLAHLELARLLEKRGDAKAALAHLWKVVDLQAELERHAAPGELGRFPLVTPPPVAPEHEG